MVTSEFSLHAHQAERVVDQYCDEKAPSVPTMLSNEFGVPYLKVLSVVNVVLSLGFYLMAINVPNSIWIGLLLGTGFLGGAVFCWVRSLNEEGEPRRKKTSRA